MLHDTRHFSASASFRAALATHPPGAPSILKRGPDPKYVEEEEIDVTLVPDAEADIHISDRAAEQLQSVAQRQNNPYVALRVTVDSGGCHGYQYKVEIAKEEHLDDYIFEHATIKPSNLYIDAISLAMINGSTVDYATELIGSSFKVVDNPRSKGSGCGCGTSWELK
ncbi:hypothetical protein BDV98DRAFT_502509 [Pterulicium gracile]|uniref:Core domain-containing protein n=1 Tax=Pterulicium gracile TaxID=1884261 RepID=A0A5C3QRW9_9AGAR|nr:hypothetical protein BDV98DRAFT_502509 [Pterula gracilis]